MENFWTRSEMLIGREGRARLAVARVIIFGIGGVGSFAVEGLVRSGIGYLELVDPDIIRPSNLNRQLMALSSNLGQPKVNVMAARCKEINPAAEVVARQETYIPGEDKKYLRPEIDYLIDAIDSVDAKIDLLAAAMARGLPVVSSMGAGNRLDPTLLQVADISKTYGCPLARVIRKGLRQRGIHRGVTVVFSPEAPIELKERPEPEPDAGGRFPPGSMVFVPAAAGLTLSSLVIRSLLKNDAGK